MRTYHHLLSSLSPKRNVPSDSVLFTAIDIRTRIHTPGVMPDITGTTASVDLPSFHGPLCPDR